MGQWSRGSDESPFIELVPPERERMKIETVAFRSTP